MIIRARRGYIFPIVWPVCSRHILYTEICNFAILGPLRPLAWWCGSELHSVFSISPRLSPVWLFWLCFEGDQWKRKWSNFMTWDFINVMLGNRWAEKFSEQKCREPTRNCCECWLIARRTYHVVPCCFGLWSFNRWPKGKRVVQQR